MRGEMLLTLVVLWLFVALDGSDANAESAGARCDRLTASPDDPDRRAAPVNLSSIDVPMALAACRAAVAQDPGEPRWHYQLGRALMADGRESEARRFWRRATLYSYPAALFDLGRLKMPGPNSLDTMYAFDAYSLLWRAANQGHAGAAEAVGRAHQYGIGIPPSPSEAARWYAVAVAEGNVSAMRRLAAMYRRGAGVPQDEGRAIALLERAAGLDDAVSMNALGWLHLANAVDRERFERAARWFLAAGDRADREGLYEIGRARLLAAADSGEAAAALDLLRRAAELGDRDAQFTVGTAYLDDPRLARDPRLAKRYLLPPAELGHVPSQLALARALLTDRPTALDRERALMWLLIAQRLSDRSASEMARPLADQLSAESRARAQAAADRWIDLGAAHSSQP